MADFPSSITSLTNPESTDPMNNPSHATQHSNANDEIEAIETELGINPAGASATVVARLDANDTAVGLNTTHRTSDGSDHTFIDQDVTSGSSPTLDGSNITGVDAANVDIADADGLITATDVEGALAENRTAINLNTTHRSSNGSDHTFIDQSVVSGASPTFDGANITGVPASGLDVASGYILVGNATGVGAAVQVSGDIALTSAGAATVSKVQNVTFDAPVAGDDGLVVYYNHGATKFDYKSVGGVNPIFTAAPGTDQTVSGIIVNMTAGENLTFGSFCYLKSDGKLWKADADAAATMPVTLMATATISAEASGLFLAQGFARDDTWAWTVGGLIYASTTPGALTQTAPSGSADIVQIVGVATHADRMYFNPQLVTVEIA